MKRLVVELEDENRDNFVKQYDAEDADTAADIALNNYPTCRVITIFQEI